MTNRTVKQNSWENVKHLIWSAVILTAKYGFALEVLDHKVA